MLHCLNTSGNATGNCTDMTVLDRQRVRMKWQREQLNNEYTNMYSVPIQGGEEAYYQFRGFLNGDLGIHQGMKPDPGMENGWPDFGIPKEGFGPCGYVNDAAFDMNCSIPRTISCPPTEAEAAPSNAGVIDDVSKGKEIEKLNSGIGGGSLKKRKADKMQNSKVAGENDTKDKRIKGCAEDGESKITQLNNCKSNKETSADTSKENSKASEVQKPDYIHVRARRGQATDSHSLAERVRREKISERMKYLQDLVPGCNKITGKAGMLDEIINYVQSLQRQVEFLSMKLATVNPRLDFNIDNFFGKEVFAACTSSYPTDGVSSEMANPAYLQFNSIEQVLACGLEMGISAPDMSPRRTMSDPVAIPEAFLDTSCYNQIQPTSAWDADFKNLFSMEFHQGRSTAFPSQPFTGLTEASSLKMEM